MRALELILYGYFYLQLLRVVLGIIIIANKKPWEEATLTMGLTSNILWIAPLLYFTDALK